MLEEVHELVYECKDKEDAEEPGDVIKTTYVCKGGCLNGVEEPDGPWAKGWKERLGEEVKI